MQNDFFRLHRTSITVFAVGLVAALLFVIVPGLHGVLRGVDRLGYPGMFLAGLMYGSGLTASIATVIFIESPRHLHPVVIALLGGLGAACYDLAVFLFTRREAGRGWFATVLERLRQRRPIPHWSVQLLGIIILASPLPDELAAGLFGIDRGRARTFFLLSFASNALGVLVLSWAR